MDRDESRTALAVSNPYPSLTPSRRDDLEASLDCVARALGHAHWQQLADAPDTGWAEPRHRSACLDEIALVFAQDRARAALRFPAELAAEREEIATGIAVIGKPNMGLPPARRGMASVEFRHELLGEAYALQRVQDCRMRPDAMRDLRDWIETHADIPGCWKMPAAPGASVRAVVERAEAAGILVEMVWLYGVGYDVSHGSEAVAKLPELLGSLNLGRA